VPVQVQWRRFLCGVCALSDVAVGQVTRVAILDEDGLTRWALKAALSRADDIDVRATLTFPDELVGLDVDVAIVVAHASRCPDLRVWLDRLNRHTRTLVVADQENLADVVTGLADGAAGYLIDGNQDALVTAVQAVAAGGVYLTDRLARGLANAALAGTSHPREPDGGLSPRERQALLHIADGCTHSQAARLMGLSKATVDTYIERVRHKLGANTKAALVRKAVELFGTQPLGSGAAESRRGR
jgi:DNA-binding NarL/FixJ family response regulator